MARGKDEKNNKKRKPLAVRDLSRPNVLWVNFAQPNEPHEEVQQWIQEQRTKKSMSEHPSAQPKEDK